MKITNNINSINTINKWAWQYNYPYGLLSIISISLTWKTNIQQRTSTTFNKLFISASYPNLLSLPSLPHTNCPFLGAGLSGCIHNPKQHKHRHRHRYKQRVKNNWCLNVRNATRLCASWVRCIVPLRQNTAITEFSISYSATNATENSSAFANKLPKIISHPHLLHHRLG